MKTLIVTASSKSKREGSDMTFNYASKSFLESIGSKYKSDLLEVRKIIAGEYQMEDGPDLSEGIADPKDPEYLPAYLRYSGRTYSKISDEAWEALNKSKEFDMVILSAAYGLMRYNEPVRNYSIQQKSDMRDTKIGTYWKKQGAKDWLMDYIKHNNITDVKFVLSTSYANIIQRDKLIAELKEMGVNAEDRQMKTAGRASMLARGSYINDLLLGTLDEGI